MDGLLAIPFAMFYGLVAGLLLLAAVSVWSRPTAAAIGQRSSVWRIAVALVSSAGFWVALGVIALSYYWLSQPSSTWAVRFYLGGASISVVVGGVGVGIERMRRRRGLGE